MKIKSVAGMIEKVTLKSEGGIDFCYMQQQLEEFSDFP